MEVAERMLEHARIPFVDIPTPPTSSPSVFPDIDEIDAIPEPAGLQQGTTEDEEGDEIDDDDEEGDEIDDDDDEVKEKDDPQNASKSGGKELLKPSEESVSGNAEPMVKEMEKDKGKAKELEKGMEYNRTRENLAVHQGDVGAFLSLLLADVRNLKPGAEQASQ